MAITSFMIFKQHVSKSKTRSIREAKPVSCQQSSNRKYITHIMSLRPRDLSKSCSHITVVLHLHWWNPSPALWPLEQAGTPGATGKSADQKDFQPKWGTGEEWGKLRCYLQCWVVLPPTYTHTHQPSLNRTPPFSLLWSLEQTCCRSTCSIVSK